MNLIYSFEKSFVYLRLLKQQQQHTPRSSNVCRETYVLVKVCVSPTSQALPTSIRVIDLHCQPEPRRHTQACGRCFQRLTVERSPTMNVATLSYGTESQTEERGEIGQISDSSTPVSSQWTQYKQLLRFCHHDSPRVN